MPPKFPLHFQEAVLKILPRTIFLSSTGLSPCIVFLSRKLGVRKMDVREVYHTTCPIYCYIGFSLDYVVFSRSYSQHLDWFIFLQVLRCFNSLCSPTSKGLNEKSHSEISGSVATFASPEHIVACHVLRQRFEPSHPSSSILKGFSSNNKLLLT